MMDNYYYQYCADEYFDKLASSGGTNESLCQKIGLQFDWNEKDSSLKVDQTIIYIQISSIPN